MKISKKLVWIVTVAMLMNCLAVIPGFADESYSNGEFTKIYSFSDYDVAFTTAVAAFPGEMIGQQGGWRNANHGYVDYNETDRTSRVFKLISTAEPIIPFGTNFLDGYMHISFDYMLTGTNDAMSLALARNTSMETPTESSVSIDGTQNAAGTVAQNEYDYNLFVNGGYTRIFNTGNASNIDNPINRSVWNNAAGWGNTSSLRQGAGHSAGQSLNNIWYKVDVYLDRDDTNNYYVYIDGVLADYACDKDGNEVSVDARQSSINYAADGNNAIKGIAFRHDVLRAYTDAAIATWDQSATTNDSVYLDNIYVNHYTSDDVKNDTVKLILDTLNNDVLEAGDKLSIGFSEALSYAPAKSDIVITDASGDVFEDFTVISDVAQATITLGETVGTGKYTIEVKNVTGAISNNSIEDVATFNTSSAPVSSSATSFNYIDEDFEGLEEGVVLPNWYFDDPDLASGVTNTRYYTKSTASGYASAVVPEERNGRTAMKLSSEVGAEDTEMFYYFPSGIANGSFKAEFDVKHENGGWTFGFINNSNYQASMYKFEHGYWTGYKLDTNWNNTVNTVSDSYTTARFNAPVASGTAPEAGRQSVLSGRAKQSVFLGMGNSTEELASSTDGAVVRAMSPYLGVVGGKNVEAAATGSVATRSETNNVEKISDDLKVEANKWTKVEVSVNDNNKTYTITVTPYNDDGTLDTSKAVTKTHKDFLANRFLGGIMGIRISRNGANASSEIGDVCFDNVKVYKEATTYLDDDFNDYTTETSYTSDRQQGPSGWQQWSDETHTQTNFTVYDSSKGLRGVTSVARNVTDSTASNDDRTMKLFFKNPTVFRVLDTPVPAGQPFAIEFEVYNHSTAANAGAETVWRFMQIGQEDTVVLPTYNYPNTVTKNGKFSISKHLLEIHTGNGPKIVDDTELKNFKQWYDSVESSWSDTNGNTTYSYITGDLMKNNVVFGRNTNSGNNHTLFHWNNGGRGTVHSNDGWSGTQLTFTNTSDGTTTQNIERFLDASLSDTAAWVNYKVVCIPESATKTTYKITATHLDTGKVYTSSFSNTRDWYTNDTYAIGFALANFAGNWSDNKGANRGNYFDNVKVYAVDSTEAELSTINLQTVSKIEAVNSLDEVTDVTEASELPMGTYKLNITFTSPVNELLPQNAKLYEETYGDGYILAKPVEGENEDYTSVLTTIKDYIQLRKSGTQADCYSEITLSADKKTVTLTLLEAADTSGKYTLGVNENISFASGAYDKLASNLVKTWSVEQEKTTNLTLSVERFTGTSYIPLEKSGVNKIADTDDVRLRIKGYSTTANLPLLLAYAYYNEDGSAVSMVNCDGGEYTLEPSGVIDEIRNVDKTKVPSDYTKFKAFLWDYSTLAPFIDAYEY